MANKVIEQRLIGDQQVPSAEYVTTIDTIDDFDPFSGVVECLEESVYVELQAPPESQ